MFTQGHHHLPHAQSKQVACDFFRLRAVIRISSSEHLRFRLVGREHIHKLQNGSGQGPHRSRIQNCGATVCSSVGQRCFGGCYRSLQLRKQHGSRLQGSAASGNIGGRQQFIRSRVQCDAIVPTPSLYQNKTHSGALLGCLLNERDVNSFLSIKAQRHSPKVVFADASDEGHLGSKPGAPHRLVRTFSPIVDPVAGRQHCLPRARQAFDFQRQASRIASHNRDARKNQRSSGDVESARDGSTTWVSTHSPAPAWHVHYMRSRILSNRPRKPI